MEELRRGVVLVFLGGLAAALGAIGCSRTKGCPDGMSVVGGRTVAGKELWCKTDDGARARWVELYAKDQPRQMCNFRGGVPEGSFTSFHEGGKPWVEGQYRDGRKSGQWIQWDVTGAKVAQAEYRFGELVAGAPVGIVAVCETKTP